MAANSDSIISSADEPATAIVVPNNDIQLQESEDSEDTINPQEELPSLSAESNIQKRESQLWREAEEVGKLKALCKACETEQLGTVQFLVEKVVPDIDLTNANLYSEGGLTPPLHVASKNGHRQIVKFFLEKGMSVMMEDENRNTPLHLAASNGHLEVAIDLLAHESQQNQEVSESERSNLLYLTNISGLTPFGCAMKSSEPHFHVAKEFLNLSVGNPVHAVADFSKFNLSTSFVATLPLDKPAKIFVVGDSSTGKSTIIKSLQEGKSGFPRRIIGLIASRLVTNVDEHFSGIITTDFANADFRRVLFHDLAGHTNYFNENLLEPGDNLEHVVFIVMINLQYSPQNAAERLIYWLNFLHYHTSRFSNESTKPNVIVVGSHKDMRRGAWRSGEKFNEVYTEALKERPQLSSCFNELMKPVCFDCRRFELSEARQLRSCLHKHCQSSIYQQLEAISPPSSCYILSQVLFDDKEIPPYLTISNLAERISQQSLKPEFSLYKLLPTEPEKLMKLCRTLCERNRLLIFENPTFPLNDLMCWIVHNMHALLTEIDKRLLILRDSSENTSEGETGSTESMPQQISHCHFGIVTREKLEFVFSKLGSPKIARKGSFQSASKLVVLPSPSPGLNTELAIELLIKYKYCEVIKKSGVSSSEMETFFFPSLLRDEGEPEPWQAGSDYSFAWCVLATKEDGKTIEFFLPRFLKKLLLCFVEKYIIQIPGLQPDDDTSSRSSCDETSVVWSRGVSWSSKDDIKVNIELHDNAIILSMYSPQGSELSCLQLRNRILTTIKAEQKKWQPDIATKEFIIPIQKKFPVQSLDNYQKISLEDMKTAILKGKTKVDGVKLRPLLFFEPCIALTKVAQPIQEILRDTNDPLTSISQENIVKIFDGFGECRSAVIQHFGLPDPSKSTTIEKYGSPQKEGGSTLDSITGISLDESNASANESSNSSITPKKLLECLNSISVMDVTEFLKQLEECGRCTSSTPSNSSESDDPFSGPEGDAPKDSTLTHASAHAHSTYHPSDNFDLQFIGSPRVLTCSSDGLVHIIKEHGIKVVFPPGAVSKGTLNIEIGVLLSGPFTFPANFKPVSPVLWLCAKQNPSQKFSKPVSITLPHYVDCNTPEEGKRFAFFKATHIDSFMDQRFTFKEFSSENSKVTRGSGTVTTKQCYLVCIAYKESEDMIVKSNYCLLSVVPKTIHTRVFNMHFCLTVHLKTCIEDVRRKFPEYEIYNKKVFKFAQPVEGGEKQYAITIHFTNHLPNDWIVGKTGFGNKICASEIDFFKGDDEHLHFLDDDQYPPRFELEINGSSATKAALLSVKFIGATEEMEFQKTLALLRSQLSGSLDRISRQSEDSLLDALITQPVSNNILEQHLDVLISCLNVGKVRPKLRQYGVLLPEDADKLIDLSTHHNTTLGSVIEKFVTLLSFKGASGLYYFKKSLEETTDGTGHQDILRELQEDAEFLKIVSDFHD